MNRSIALVLSAAIGLAGCSGVRDASNRLLPDAPRHSDLRGAAHTRKTLLHFNILWNERDTAQSISIAVNDPNHRPRIIARTSGTSSFTLKAPVGYDALYLRLWSGPNGTGKLLRSAGVARRVVANDPAPVVIELAGACTQIGFTPAAGQLFVETLSSPAGATSGFTLVGPQTETFFATPEDDRGNILLNAAGPDVRLGSSGAHLFRVRRDGTIDNAFQL